MTALRAAVPQDLEFLRGFSERPPDRVLSDQISDRRLRIIEADGRPIGFLKFCVLWETLPFIEVLVIVEAERGRGHGTRAVPHWESEMASRGFDLVLTSSQSDETAQHFWRKLGYRDCGVLALPGKPAELFMQRRLGGDADERQRLPAMC